MRRRGAEEAKVVIPNNIAKKKMIALPFLCSPPVFAAKKKILSFSAHI